MFNNCFVQGSIPEDTGIDPLTHVYPNPRLTSDALLGREDLFSAIAKKTKVVPDYTSVVDGLPTRKRFPFGKSPQLLGQWVGD